MGAQGAAHQRQDPYRYSPYDTAIFVVQTDKGARKWAADDRFERELRKAFAECVPSDTAVQRQLKQTPAAVGAASGGKGGGKGAPRVPKTVLSGTRGPAPAFKKRPRDDEGGKKGKKRKRLVR